MKVRNAQVTVLIPVKQAPESEGILTVQYTPGPTLTGVLLPEGSDSDFEQYEPGFIVTQSYRFFYKGVSEYLKEGNKLLLENGNSYMIKKVLDYNKVMDVRIGSDTGG